jgi:hypothetical protein
MSEGGLCALWHYVSEATDTMPPMGYVLHLAAPVGESSPLPSLLAPAKRRTIVGYNAPAARIGAEEGLGHRGGARIYSP